MNILLTGFMCAGKTTIGRKLAKLLEYSFIDTDTEIEEDQGCSVTDIFKYGGEECFRDMETRQLEKLKSVDNSVIATGGGDYFTQAKSKNATDNRQKSLFEGTSGRITKACEKRP